MEGPLNAVVVLLFDHPPWQPAQCFVVSFCPSSPHPSSSPADIGGGGSWPSGRLFQSPCGQTSFVDTVAIPIGPEIVQQPELARYTTLLDKGNPNSVPIEALQGAGQPENTGIGEEERMLDDENQKGVVGTPTSQT